MIENHEEQLENLSKFYDETVHTNRHKSEWEYLKAQASSNGEETPYWNFIRAAQPDYNHPYTKEEVSTLIDRASAGSIDSDELKLIMLRDIVLYQFLSGNKAEIDPSLKRLIKDKEKTLNNPFFKNYNEVFEEQEKKEANALDNLSRDSFLDEDLVLDKNGRKVDKKDLETQILNGRGESALEFSIKQIVRSVSPGVSLGIYGAQNVFGFDPIGKLLSGREFIKPKEKRDSFKTTNLDENVLFQTAPDALMFASRFTNNRALRIGAASTPAIFSMIANAKERGNPFRFSNESKELDWVQTGMTFVPLFVELLRPLFTKIDTTRIQENISEFDFNKIGGSQQLKLTDQQNDYYNQKRSVRQPKTF